MSRTLVLMRHGKSGYPPATSDHDRPLADRGRREATLAGEWLHRDGVSVDLVICSTATRTRETLQYTGIDAPVVFVDEIYGGSPFEILEALRVHVGDDVDTALVVGHSPGMPDTALLLDPEGDIDRFPTSAYAVLDIASEWGEIGTDLNPANKLRLMQIPRAD